MNHPQTVSEFASEIARDVAIVVAVFVAFVSAACLAIGFSPLRVLGL